MHRNGQIVGEKIINLLKNRNSDLIVLIDEEQSIVDEYCTISIINLSMICTEDECVKYDAILDFYYENNITIVCLINQDMERGLEKNLRKLGAYLISEEQLYEILYLYDNHFTYSFQHYIDEMIKDESLVEAEKDKDRRNFIRRDIYEYYDNSYRKVKKHWDHNMLIEGLGFHGRAN